MEFSSWFKINRDIFNSDIWQDVATFRLFFYLIGKASHRDGFKYRGLILNEGQYVCSYRKLADELSYREGRGYKKYSLQTIKNSVTKLIDAERVNVKRTELGTLFTVVNYAKYQRLETFENISVNDINDEPQTLSERTVNVNRTNSEQYQELKNLRTKELKEFKRPTATTVHEVIPESIIFYQENIGELKPHIENEILFWINEFDDRIVKEALITSVERNNPKWSYAKSILKAWKKKNIKTIGQANAEKQSFKHKSQSQKTQGNSYKNKKQASDEVIPDWFADRHKRNGQAKELTDAQKKEEEEIKALLQKHV